MGFGFPSRLHPHHPRIWDGLTVIISRLKAANLVCARGRVGMMCWGEAHTRGLAQLSAQLKAGCAPRRGLPGDLGEVETLELAASDPWGFAQQEREAARAPCWVFAAQQAAVTGVSCGSTGLEALTAGPRVCRRSPPRFPGTSRPRGNRSEPCGPLQLSPTGAHKNGKRQQPAWGAPVVAGRGSVPLPFGPLRQGSAAGGRVLFHS